MVEYFSRNNSDLGNGGLGKCVQQLGAMTNNATVLLSRAGKEA